jgi:hypothetical protein
VGLAQVNWTRLGKESHQDLSMWQIGMKRKAGWLYKILKKNSQSK